MQEETPIRPVPPPQPSKPTGGRSIVIVVVVILIVVSIGLTIFSAVAHTFMSARKTPNATDIPLLPATPDQVGASDEANKNGIAKFRPAQPAQAPSPYGTDPSGIPAVTPQQQAAATQFGPTGQPSVVDANGNPVNGGSGISPAKQAKLDREARRKEAMSASSIVEVANAEGNEKPNGADAASSPSTEEATATVRPVSAPANVTQPKNPFPWNSATGQIYQLMEGSVLEAVLRNRLDGEFTGPVSVMLASDVYSFNFQHVLIPQGTIVLGEATRVGSTDQSRLAVAFHRLIMPDGYSISLDKDPALDVIGSTGLHDKVNRHYAKIFGVSLAVGAIAGLAQIGNTGTSLSPMAGIRDGVTSQTSQEATQILDRFLNVMPTITIREGTRVRIWLTDNIQLPSYDNHTVRPNL